MNDPTPSDPIHVAIQGAAGRMGQRLAALTEQDPQLTLAGTFGRTRPISAPACQATKAKLIVDFSSATALHDTLAAAITLRIPAVIGTTGLTAADHDALDEAAKHIPVLEASNFSIVVNVLHHLARQAVQLLGEGWDLEVLEAHHRDKKDAPSGTALDLAKTLADAAGRNPACIQLARHGDNAPRQPEDITVQALRIGDHPGEHTLHFAAPGERLELRHVATSRDSYALGALRAAKWLATQPAERYTMNQVLGL